LDLKGRGITGKAKELEVMELDDILELKFKDDKFPSGTVGNWNDGNDLSVREQLQSYIAGDTVQEEIVGKKFRAWVVVIIGSRQMLMREMDGDGNWVGEFQLAMDAGGSKSRTRRSSRHSSGSSQPAKKTTKKQSPRG
jgi:hypothetical protein